MKKIIIDQSDKVAGVIAVVATFLTWLFGGWELNIQILVIFMAADFTTGYLHALIKGKADSRVGFKGITKKFVILMILILAVALDRLLGTEWTFRTLVIYFYASMEGLSILENAAKLGVPIPEKLKDKLVQLSEDSQDIKESEV